MKPKLLIYKNPQNGQICYQLPIDEEHGEKVRLIKDHIVASFSRQGYEGYSLEIDKYYDPFSIYFYVEDTTGGLVATLRITKKTKDNALPFEAGLKNDGTKYALEEKIKVGDVNSFTFNSYQALPLLFATASRYAHEDGIRKGFCLLDDSAARIKKIYLSAGFDYSTKYNEKIFFPTFGKTENGVFKPTYWSIMEISHENICGHSKNADKYLRVAD